jgi:phosphate transport system protein
MVVAMNRKYDAELREIRTRLMELGGEVDLMINNSVKSLVQRDSDLAESVIAFVREINILGEEIDSHCMHLLGHSRLAAQDQHFVIQALKIVIDLERICEQCSSIAGSVLELNREVQLKSCIDIPFMAETALTSVKEALSAFLGGNNALAAKVFHGALMVKELNDQIQRVLLTVMMEDPATIWRAMRLNSISKYLETIADHAANIAETVVFMVNGKGRDWPAA